MMKTYFSYRQAILTTALLFSVVPLFSQTVSRIYVDPQKTDEAVERIHQHQQDYQEGKITWRTATFRMFDEVLKGGSADNISYLLRWKNAKAEFEHYLSQVNEEKVRIIERRKEAKDEAKQKFASEIFNITGQKLKPDYRLESVLGNRTHFESITNMKYGEKTGEHLSDDQMKDVRTAISQLETAIKTADDDAAKELKTVTDSEDYWKTGLAKLEKACPDCAKKIR